MASLIDSLCWSGWHVLSFPGLDFVTGILVYMFFFFLISGDWDSIQGPVRQSDEIFGSIAGGHYGDWDSPKCHADPGTHGHDDSAPLADPGGQDGQDVDGSWLNWIWIRKNTRNSTNLERACLILTACGFTWTGTGTLCK